MLKENSVTRTFLAIPAALALVLLAGQAIAQNTSDIAARNTEVLRLYEAGDFQRALPRASEALAHAERTLGPEHTNTLSAVNNLALLYQVTGHYAEAEPLYTRALAGIERALGRDHPGTLIAINNLARLYHEMSRYAEAEPLYVRALASRERVLGRDHPDTLSSANNLASLYQRTGRYAEAEPLYARTLASRERVLGHDHSNTLLSMSNLASLYQATGRYPEAQQLHVRALASRERVLGRDHPDTLISINNLANLYQMTGRYSDAESLFVRALAVRARILGRDHPDTLLSASNLAGLYEATGRYGETEPLYVQVLEVRERVLGRDHRDTLLSVNNLASLYQATGRYAEAEPLYARALADSERALGRYHPDTLFFANNLAALYEVTGRYSEAERLYALTLAALERVLGRDHPDTLTSMNNLAALYRATSRNTEAEPLYSRALAARERVLGRDHPDTLTSVNNLASLYQATGRHAAAEPLYARSLAGRERALGRDHPHTLTSVSNLAFHYSATRRFAQAEPLYVRALASYERVLGRDHPDTIAVMNNLAVLYDKTGRIAEAEGTQRRAIAGWRARYRRSAFGSGGDRQATRSAGLDGNWHMALVARLGTNPRREVQSAALIGAQLGRADAAGAALQAAAARFASGSDRVAELIRARDSANTRLTTLEAQRTQVFVQNRSGEATALSGQIETARRETEAATAAIASAFPAYTDLVATDFVDLAELQSANGLLVRGEALLTLVEAPGSGAMQPAWLAMLVTRDRVAVKQLPGAPADVAARIAALRAQAAPVSNRPPAAFDLAAARQLYRDLIAPLEPELAGVTRLLVVPDGPLQSLPLELLVAVPPPAGASGDDAYRQATWLGDRYEIAVLPSVSALRALRRHAGRSAAPNPLIAFADPAFGAAARQNLLASLSSTGGAVSDVCALPSVPATARIGESLRRALGADAGALLLGRDASEARLNQLNASGALRRARIVAFNTHGLTASEVPVAPEPALALSPDRACGRGAPASRPPSGDGLLTASEIVGLNLDADWVLLTACNTAAADGAAGAEPLSGLARAFFYAGARALLVSHWPALVSNDPNVEGPTELLIAELFAPTRSALSKAAALAQARQAVRQRFPHPAYWATFTLVGDGR